MVAAGGGASVLPETAVPPELAGVRRVNLRDVPPRRLGLTTARDAQLSLADRAVRDGVLRLIRGHRRVGRGRGMGSTTTRERAGAA
jgi:DNA-binding transcriptional LysR family regulator